MEETPKIGGGTFLPRYLGGDLKLTVRSKNEECDKLRTHREDACIETRIAEGDQGARIRRLPDRAKRVFRLVCRRKALH